MKFDTDSLSFELSHDLIIPGDIFGIVTASTRSFDALREELSALLSFSSGRTSLQLSYSDISLLNDTGYFIYDSSFPLFNDVLAVNLGLTGEISHVSGNSIWHPEAGVMFPLFTDEETQLSVRFAGAAALSAEGFSGWGLSVSLPLNFPALDFNLGLAYSSGDVHFGSVLNGYETERKKEDSLTVYTSLLYETELLSVVLDLQLPFDSTSLAPVRGEDYFSLEFSTSVSGISIGAGLRMSGLLTSGFEENFKNNGQSFVSLGYSNRAISTTLSLYYDRQRGPQVSLSATIGLYNALYSSGDAEGAAQWIDLSLSTGYVLSSQNSSLIIQPSAAFHFTQNNMLILRLPLYLSTQSGSFTLVRMNSNGLLDFGMGADTGLELIYEMMTDIFSLIDTVKLGKETDNIYFLAGRKDGLFTTPSLISDFWAAGPDSAMSLKTGFNLASGTSVSLYINDTQQPRIFDLTVSIMPMGTAGPQITSETALDIKFASDDYQAYVVSRFSMSQNFAGRVRLSAFAQTFIEFSPDDFTLHFLSREKLEYAAGLALDSAWNGFRLSISSGALRGRAREIWWDEFSFWDGSDINDNTYYSDTALFLRTGLEYSLRQFSIGLEYRADNLLHFTDESGKSSDRLRLSLSFSLNEFSIRGLIMKKNFASSAADLFDEDEWTDGSLLYALSIEKTFAHLHFSAAVYLSYDMQEDDHWLNASVRSSASPHIGFALMTGVSL